MNDISMAPVTDASAWRGPEMETDRSWEYFLEDGHISELETALGALKKSGLKLAEISAADFPLPRLAKMLASISADLRSGRGFALLRGFPVEAHDDPDLELMYYGLCRHIGMGMTQNGDAGLIHYVTAGALKPNQGSRGVGFPRFVPLHMDLMDIVSLLCVRQAGDAPESHLASSTTIYNEILRRRPDLMARLQVGFEWDRMGEHGAGENPTSGYQVPLFSQVDGVVSCRYNRNWITSANARKNEPMSEADEAILDLIDEIAAETRLAFPFQNGDVQFCNNYTILHGRDAHAEEKVEDRMRVLMRIWLNVPRFRQFSDEAVVRYGIGYHGNLGWSAEDLAAGRNKTPRARRGDGAVLMNA